jgi:flavodoxin
LKALVLYDSLFGNTEIIAQTIRNTIGQNHEVGIATVGMVIPKQMEGIQLLVVGSPNRQFGSTVEMKNFLDNIPKDGLLGIKVAAFDTRFIQKEAKKLRPIDLKLFGYASERIADQLVIKGGVLVAPAEGFYVERQNGLLVDGEIERAGNWARKISA